MEKDIRPKLQLEKTKIEKSLDLICAIIFLANLVYLLAEWSHIPSQVPTHFNALGEADAWGNKGSLLILPFISVILWGGLHALERYPHSFNYLIQITPENAERQYKNARLMLNLMKNQMVLLFIYISYASIQVAKGESSGLGVWGLPVSLVVIFGTIIIFSIRSFRLK